MTDETTDLADTCVLPVRIVVGLSREGLLEDHERRTLLDALGHGSCVPLEHDNRNTRFVRRHDVNERRRRAEAERDHQRARAERAEAERDRCHEALRGHPECRICCAVLAEQEPS